jgi:hypothetical protein
MFSRTSTQVGIFGRVIKAVCKRFQWRRVGMIYPQKGAAQYALVSSALSAGGIVPEVSRAIIEGESGRLELQAIGSSRLRIVLLLGAAPAEMLMLLLEASALGLTGKGWVYLTDVMPPVSATGRRSGAAFPSDLIALQPWLSNADAQPLGDVFNPTDEQKLLQYSLFLQDALDAIALALNRSKATDVELKDDTSAIFPGDQVMKQLANLRLPSGSYFDSDGNIVRSWVAYQFRDSALPVIEICLDPVVASIAADGNSKLAPVIWAGNSEGFPVSDPPADSYTIGAGTTVAIVLGSLAAVVLIVLIGALCVIQMRKNRLLVQQQEELANARMLQAALEVYASKKGVETEMLALNIDPMHGTMVFVFTDIMNSTDASNANPKAMNTVQKVHDSVMREGIAKFGGYSQSCNRLA